MRLAPRAKRATWDLSEYGRNGSNLVIPTRQNMIHNEDKYPAHNPYKPRCNSEIHILLRDARNLLEIGVLMSMIYWSGAHWPILDTHMPHFVPYPSSR